MPRSSQLLDVVQLKPLAERIARRLARQPADIDDLVQVGLLAYISDYKRLARRALSVRLNSAWSLAHAILRRAMQGYYGSAPERASWRTESLNEQPVGGQDRFRVVTSNEKMAHFSYSGEALIHFAAENKNGQQDELLEMHDYLDALERACGSRARMIAENLMSPMGECAQRILVEVQRKRRAQSNGYSHSQPRVRVSQRAIREALALDKQTWNAELKRVRGFTREWLTKTA